MRRSGIGRLLDLVGAALGESDGEEAEEVVVGGHHSDVGLNEGLPLADERAELVRGEVETVEVGQAVLALDLVDTELDLAEGVVLILLQIGQRNLEDAALQSIVGVLETGGAVDQGLADADRHVRTRLDFAATSCAVRRVGDGILLSDGERRGSLLFQNRQSLCQKQINLGRNGDLP